MPKTSDQYRPTRQPGSRVYVVEVVMPWTDDRDIDDALERGLSEFQYHGAAEIVGDEFLADTFEEAGAILSVRASNYRKARDND